MIQGQRITTAQFCISISHIFTLSQRGAGAEKKAFTLCCFPSRTSGAAPDQNEEFAAVKDEPPLFGCFQEDPDIIVC